MFAKSGTKLCGDAVVWHSTTVRAKASAKNSSASPAGHPKVVDRAGGTRTAKYTSWAVAVPVFDSTSAIWKTSPGAIVERLSDSASWTWGPEDTKEIAWKASARPYP